MNRIRLRTVGIAMATAAACSALTLAVTARRQEKSAQDKWAAHYYSRVDQFKRENAAARNIVLVGSSHIERFDAAKYLPGRRVINRGIAADRIGIGERGVLRRLDSSVFDCNPGFIILENGANDLGELWRHGTPSIDEVEQCYRAVVRQITTRLPDVPLVIVGVFPTRGRFAELKPFIVEFNKRLERIAADFGCPFMDVYKPFADEAGLLREDLTGDGLHLNDAGYRIWTELIEKILPPRDAPRDEAPRKS